jgi:hypothetical protein
MVEMGTRVEFAKGKAIPAVVEGRKGAMDLYLIST